MGTTYYAAQMRSTWPGAAYRYDVTQVRLVPVTSRSGPGTGSARKSWLPQDQHDRNNQQHRAECDQGVSHAIQLERAADTHQEQHGRQEDCDPDIIVAHEPRVIALIELRVGLVIEPVGLRLGRELVLRHVGRAGRGMRVVQRVGRHPRVEGDPELRPEAAFRD